MKYILFGIIFIALLSCEDKVSEPTTTYVSTPSICPPSHPEAEPSRIGFSGAKSISNITKTSANINWDHVEGVSSYHIIRVSSTDREIVKTLLAPKINFKLTALTPDTEYKFLVRAMDRNGHIDINTEILSFKTLPWPNYTNQKAIQLNGSQSISLGSSSNFALTENFTISLWAKTSLKSTSESRLLTIHQGDFASTAVSISFLNDKVQLLTRDSSGELKVTNKSFPYEDGVWHQYSLIYNKKYISLYIDGNRIIRKKAQIDTLGRHPFFVGSYTGIQKGFIGKVDELGIFATVFSKRDIQELIVTQDLRAHSKAQSLKHWYQFGDNTSDSPSNLEDVIGGLTGSPINLTSDDFTLDSPII